MSQSIDYIHILEILVTVTPVALGFVWAIKSDTKVLRARLDTVFQKNIIPKIQELDSNINIHYFGAADMFGIGRIGIMEYYCTMINGKYGTFGDGHKIPDELRWKYTPEYQLHFLLNEYCELNNIKSSALHSISNSVNEFCPIYR